MRPLPSLHPTHFFPPPRPYPPTHSYSNLPHLFCPPTHSIFQLRDKNNNCGDIFVQFQPLLTASAVLCAGTAVLMIVLLSCACVVLCHFQVSGTHSHALTRTVMYHVYVHAHAVIFTVYSHSHVIYSHLHHIYYTYTHNLNCFFSHRPTPPTTTLPHPQQPTQQRHSGRSEARLVQNIDSANGLQSVPFGVSHVDDERHPPRF